MSTWIYARLHTYSDEDDLFAIYSSPFIYELEDFSCLLLDVRGRFLSLKIGLGGEGGWRGFHWGGRGVAGGAGEYYLVCNKWIVRANSKSLWKGVRRWPTGESRMWVSLLLIDHHHPSAGGSDYVVVAPTARVFEIRISRSSLLRYAISRPSSRYLRSQPTPPCPSSSSSSSPPPCSQPASSSASSLSPSSPHPQVSTPPTPIPPSLTHKQR